MTITRDQMAALPQVRNELDDAVHALIGTQSHDVDRDGSIQRVWGASRYAQLSVSLDTPKATGRTMKGGSQPPIWVDATDLKQSIDTTILGWWPHCQDLGATRSAATIEATLHGIVDHTWRPDDVAGLVHMARSIASFAVKIDKLFDPPKRLTLAASCPACGANTVYRPDSAGETVRQPALQLSADGCVCQACRHMWAPEYFAHLARTLGTMPEGVLE